VPGTYRVRATFADDTHLRGKALDGPDATPLPSLHQGSHGRFVRLLERRLVELHYRLEGVDRRYDLRTADAVVAFRKVQGMDRVFTVGPTVWRALADPIVPHARADTQAFHFEVDQTHQVLLTVERGAVTSISHISTGKPSTPTHDGSFRVYRKVATLTGGGLYWPSYFDGLRALHGYVEVPTYPASHGCVRIPYWNAKWVYRHAPIGTRVIVYHT
jgi:lipoprotein-anchoring transpeptidase ErfK/SrfK